MGDLVLVRAMFHRLHRSGRVPRDAHGGTNRELRVYFRPPQGTAILGVDYSLEPFGNDSVVRIPAGSRSVNVRLYPIDDALIEGDETAIIGLNELPPSAPFSDLYRVDQENASVTLVIHDDDPANRESRLRIARGGATL